MFYVLGIIFFFTVLWALVSGRCFRTNTVSVLVLAILNIVATTWIYSIPEGVFSLDWIIKFNLSDWFSFAGMCVLFSLLPSLLYFLSRFTRVHSLHDFKLPAVCLFLVIYSALNLVIMHIDILNILLHFMQGWLYAVCTLPAIALVVGYQYAESHKSWKSMLSLSVFTSISGNLPLLIYAIVSSAIDDYTKAELWEIILPINVLVCILLAICSFGVHIFISNKQREVA
ncbi:MAG: hypothetical protein ACI3XR_07520 [Eubacteriales bacterium]